MPFDPLSSNSIADGVTAEEVVAIALDNIGIEWTFDGCTAFVWGVTNLAGAPFFDLQDRTVGGDPALVQNPNEGYIVPHSPGIISGTDNIGGDGWTPVYSGFSAADLRASLQPGDVVRVYAAGNIDEVSGTESSGFVAHSFIVVSVEDGDVQVVDNWNTAGIVQHSLDDIEAAFASSGRYQSAFVSRLDEDFAAENFGASIAGNGYGDFSVLASAEPYVVSETETVLSFDGVGFDATRVYHPTSVTVDDIEYLYYAGLPFNNRLSVGVATSDGGDFVKLSDTDALISNFDSTPFTNLSINPVRVFYDEETSLWTMYYGGQDKNLISDNGTRGFGIATSQNGFDWDLQQSPLLAEAGPGEGYTLNEIVRVGGQFVAYVTDVSPNGSIEGISTSADGVNFTPLVGTNYSNAERLLTATEYGNGIIALFRTADNTVFRTAYSEDGINFTSGQTVQMPGVYQPSDMVVDGEQVKIYAGHSVGNVNWSFTNIVTEAFYLPVSTFDVSPTASGNTLVFFDDFERPDNTVVGNGWVELNEAQPEDPAYTGSSTLNVVDGRLEVNFDTEGNSPRTATKTQPYMKHALPVNVAESGFEISYTFQPNDEERPFHFVGLADASAGEYSSGSRLHPSSGIGVELIRSDYLIPNSGIRLLRFDGDRVDEYDDPTDEELIVWENTSFQFENTDDINVSFRMEADGLYTLTVSNGVETDVFTGAAQPLTETLDEVVISTTSAGFTYYFQDNSEILRFDDLAVHQLGEADPTVLNAPNLNILDSVAQALAIEENTTAIIGLNPSDDSDSEGNGLTYSVSGSSASLVTIDQNNGFLSFLEPPDFENSFPSQVFNGFSFGYEFTVTVTDSDGLSDSADFFVRVTNVDDEPVSLEDALTIELEYFARQSAYDRGPLGGLNPSNPASNSNLDAFLSGWEVEDEYGGNGNSFRAILLRKEGFNPVLAFRGSTDAADWAENFDLRGISASEFLESLSLTGQSSGQTLESLLLSSPDITLTGHSQGAAQAQLAAITAFELQNGDYRGKVVTFNSPGIPSADASLFIEKVNQVTHFVNASDIVSVAGEAFITGDLVYYDFDVPDAGLSPLGVRTALREFVNSHSGHWAQENLLDLNLGIYPNALQPVPLLNTGPSFDVFASGAYSPLGGYGQDTDYSASIFLVLGALSLAAKADTAAASIRPFYDTLTGQYGDAAEAFFEAVLNYSSTTNLEAMYDDFAQSYETRSELETFRQTWGPEFATFLNNLDGTLDSLISSGAFIGGVLGLVTDLGRFLATSASGAALATVDFYVAIGDTILDGVEFAGDAIVALGDLLIDSTEGVLLQTWTSANDFASWIGDRFSLDEGIVVAEGSHTGSTPAVVLNVEEAEAEVLSSSSGGSIFLLTDTGTTVEIESGGNIIWGFAADQANTYVTGGISETDVHFIQNSFFETEDLDVESGSAIIRVDLDQDGAGDITITWEGNYRLESIVAEQGVDGTYIRYLGNALPEATNDLFSTTETRPFATGNVLANDTDGDGDTLSLAGLDLEGTRGLVIDNGDGTFKYSPNGAFDSLREGETATDTFGYFVSDGVDTVRGEVTVTITGEDHPEKTEKVDIDFIKKGHFGRTVAEVTVTEADGTIQTDTEALGWFSRQIGLNDADIKITSGGPGHDVVSAIYGGLGVSSRADGFVFKDRLDIDRKESLKLSLVDEDQISTRLLLDFAEQEGDVQLVFFNDGERVAKDTFSYDNGMLELADLAFDKVEISGFGREDVRITGIEFDRHDETEFWLAEVDTFDFL